MSHGSVDHGANVAYGAHLANDENPYHPFNSQIEWEVARWAKLRGATLTAFLDLLSIDGVSERLGLSFKNTNELNKIIDYELPTGRPKFKREQVVVAGKPFNVYYRDIPECIKSLYGDPDFARYLTFAPKRHYTDEDQTVRLFHDMYTGKWWWNMQKKLDQHCPGGTIIPIIISTDKTQVTMFRNKSAYPVYLTIGNIPKEIRRKPSHGGHILLAYLPNTRLEQITNKASCRWSLANLYHTCLSRVLAPLQHAGLEGINMHSGDGALHRCHPLFASFVGDYPEQLLATGIKFGDCPKCDVKKDDTESNTVPLHLRKIGEVLDALAALNQGNLAFVRTCATVGIKPVIHSFWEKLPFANIFQGVMPDVLHQLYQGLVKHLLAWLEAACGATEIDARCQWLPPNHHIRLFTKGITTLSCVSGTKHAQICCFLLGIIIDIRLPNNLNAGRLLQAVWGLLNFVYLAQYPCHSTKTLQLLDEALDLFHENKLIFVDLGIRNNFNLPKLHAARHYPLMIMLFGSTDNYNTEYTERLHIDLAKDAYRATNHKDEFAQMTHWFERKEKILRHQKYVTWRLAGGHESDPYHSCPPDMTFSCEQVMTKHPSAKSVSLEKLTMDYGATHFRDALARYIAQQTRGNDPTPLHGHALDALAHDIHLPFRRLPIFHKVKWCSVDACSHGDARVTLDSVHAKPQRKFGSRLIAHRSDTALVRLRTNSKDLRDFRVGQVRVMFTFPPKSIPLLFPPTVHLPTHLAYVEWFTPFPPAADRNSRLYKLLQSLRGGDTVASIVPVADIERSVHLIPRFGVMAPREWTSDTVLEDCDTFWLNSYIDRYTFSMFR
ncbi:hypothetical protein DFJ58DRAFT_672192 [Suillus subalutaceus]|uniref:uncharacterized protein n=1 Tax=Suillus subalutaceus TaxID=48586 RepID=UPI001B880013|nr:uncharacterized protein DFJ58DRAFT_672192 [Suillus subalutaceus]KAG1828595.1 hypothetical protein DFJ58DRAFT_672192 [Suillus subalutaceus]